MGDEIQQSKSRPTRHWTPLTETKWFRRGKQAIYGSVLLLLACAIILLLGYVYLKSQPLPPPEQPLITSIYADDGTLLDELHYGERRNYVPLADMPEALIQAVIAVEDRHFYQHFGVSLRGVARAAWTDIKNRALVEGASTITMQLARNLYLTQDRTWTRKIKEMIRALQLEIHFDKDDILEMYLNEVYFGHATYGVGQAADMFFGKEPADLTVAESALLAGVPKGAGVYSPYLHPDNAKRRQLVVLNEMQQEGYLSAEQMNTAATVPLHYEPLETSQSFAPYFRDYVKRMAINRYGLEEKEVEAGGLRIYTTLDPEFQQKAEQAVQQHIEAPLQTALVAVEATTGEIKAMVGGLDYTESEYNRVLAERQPGSAFKPFLYLAALEQGMTPATMMMSEPTTFTFANTTYEPRNYGNAYQNEPITMQEALVRSDNVYAVKTHFEIGRDHLVDMSHRLGIHQPLEPHPSLALGTIPVSPLEMATAFTTIARQGNAIQPTAIRRIEDKEGNVLVEVQPESDQVVSPASAFVLTHMMQGVFKHPHGTGHSVGQKIKRPIAGKTGTTNWDSWLVGFAPNLVTAVWVGYDKNEELPRKEAVLSKWVWGTFMEQALADTPARVFPVPKNTTAAYIDPETGLLATKHCPTYRLDYFVSGTEPTDTCAQHRANESDTPQRDPSEDNLDKSWLDKIKDWWHSP